MQTVAEQEIIIAGPPVLPYDQEQMLHCVICGNRVSRWCRFISWLKGGYPRAKEIAFCDGGKEPVETDQSMMAMMTGSTERRHICAGIAHSHLHLRCHSCGHRTLMATKAEAR